MKKVENIAAQDRQLPFTVPTGYFDSLQERVMARCSEQPVEETKRLSLWYAVRQQLAFAAGFALLVGVATLVVRLTATPSFSSSNEIAVASYISTFDIQAYEAQAETSDGLTSEDAIVDYLLSSGDVGYLAMGY